MSNKLGSDQTKRRGAPFLQLLLATALTNLSIGSSSALAAQSSAKQGTDAHATRGCMQAVLAAGYTLENDDSRVSPKNSSDKPDSDDKDDLDDKDDSDDKDTKDDNNEKEDRDNDDDNRASSATPASRKTLSGLLMYEVEKEGVDYTIYIDPQTCQIRTAIKDS
jgi:hypothetical protein